MAGVELTGRISGNAEHRPDREVDVACDDDDSLADREERDDGRGGQHLLDVREAEEPVIVDRRSTHDE